MLAKRIIPCLDVRDGVVVKGVNFVGIKEVGDPVDCAIEYDRQGADEITFLDITATHEGRSTMIDVVRETARNVFVPLTVGGGIRSVDDFRALLRAGADKISVNSAAVPGSEAHQRGRRTVRQPVRRCGDRRAQAAGGGLHRRRERRADRHGDRRRRVGKDLRAARRGGDPAHLDGSPTAAKRL